MSKHIKSISVHMNLTTHGDALLYGVTSNNDYLSGVSLKQQLFAWHEASFYGTELEVQQVQGLELVLLPAELVIPFFAEQKLLEHIAWTWGEQAEQLSLLSPLLMAEIEAKRFKPSFSAFRSGMLQWTWDNAALNKQIQAALQMLDEDNAIQAGLQAAFSAVVFDLCYGTETTAADLRREYPLLFANSAAAAAGLDAQSWLISIGWKADQAPFRPMLQLLEPQDTDATWQLKLILQDKLDEAVLVPLKMSAAGEALGSWPASWTAAIRERERGWLDRLRACLPRERLAGPAEDLLHSPLDNDAAWRFLAADSPRLLEAGWQVLLPAWWETASRRKPRLRAKISSRAESAGESLFGLDSLIEFDWRIAIGESDLTESEFNELVARNERLVRFRGQWISLDPALLAQIRKAMAGIDRSEGLSFQDVLQLHLLGSSDEPEGGPAEQDAEQAQRIMLEVELNEHLAKLVSQLSQRADWPVLDVPSGLQAELRAYQREGYAWLAFLRRFGLGACLADDMGLGKTVQLIAYLLHLKESTADLARHSPSLIICPTSVLGNWQKEISRFAPSLNIMLHYGSRRLEGEAFQLEMQQADVILTSFATATLDQELLKTYHWASICLDEAQNIKNAQTKQSAAVRSFTAQHRIALTGTPIENRLSELWSIYDFMNPGFLGTAHGFQQRFSNPIEKEHNTERTADLQKLVKPFMLRRKKKDPAIQLDLPDKNEMKTYIHLTAEQGALYNQTVNQLMDRMQKLEGIERKGAILSAIMQLKQICDHPMLLSKESITEATASSDDDIDTELLISRSAKLERLLAMVKELRDEGERCLIFTQYLGMGQLLQTVLQQELQEPILYLNGSTAKPARDRMIDKFQSQSLPAAEQPNIFILSIKAGGVGLNLTAANHVFHFDRWWNPAVENQATDRAYRIGQTKDVQVHKFISLGTLEERIDEMLENKQQLSENVISSSEGWITELSTEALKELFTLRQDWSSS
ncbi:ATP-dependent helicase [Paenibacillus sp. FSL H8-0548]|uniref:DEAD/DEAH box helicase n=1 Tax=Paenibacillus sp. FSL H8-0548 TaxID=1920422 RepID=UPI00096C0C10|nr:DEAD/DEAH box helicase [Paenibacillus sp. FSL H8-0548]OMF21176.1 ATP-dependent helicase [Paenibacillus sp. FSL H8-0548]